MAKEDIAKGPVGAKMIEMLRTPSFARGLSPSMLFDLAKDKGIITKEQQADFKSRVGKDKTALQDFNKIVTEAGEPRLVYTTQSPLQLELLKEKGLSRATSFNKTERINLLKTTDKLVKEAAEMDAPTDVKQKTFLDQMRKSFADFADNPVVKRIANNALKILAFIPSGPLDALEFMPKDLMLQLQEGMNIGDMEPEPAAMGGMMNINDMITPVGYKMGTRKGKLVGDKEKGIATIQIGLMEDVDDINIQGMKLLLQEAADSLDELDKIDKLSSKEIINMFQDLMSKKGT